MKILHIIASLNPAHGGPVHGLQNYIPEFYSRGMRNEILSLDDPAEPFFANSPFPIIHALGPSKRPWCYTSKLIPWLREKSANYDVLLIHGLWLYHGYAVNKVITEIKKQHQPAPKVFVICHGMLDPYFQHAPDRKWKSIRNFFYWNLIESKLIKNADGVLFTCEEELRLAEKTFKNYDPRSEQNIGYGVASPPARIPAMTIDFYKRCPELINKKFILFLGRIHEKKGVDILISAYEDYYASLSVGISPEYALLIVGPGIDSNYGRMLKESIQKSRFKNSIFIEGMLTGNDKWGAFYHCEMFILPSHQENFGIAVVEALACSKPVLISNKVNIWREIEGDQAGFVEADSKDGTLELFAKWNKLSDDQRLQMNKNARNCFETHFAIEPAVTRLINRLSINA